MFSHGFDAPHVRWDPSSRSHWMGMPFCLGATPRDA
jgi:hypothetical protein